MTIQLQTYFSGYDYEHRKLKPHEMNETTRYWGDFKCHKCKRKWSSAATWKGKTQKCQKCNINIHPYAQVRLELL